jgi:hypothetical protein
VEVNYLPRDGTHVYTFTVDPDDELVEIGVAPNELSLERTVTDGGPGSQAGGGVPAYLWSALAVVALLVTAVAVVALLRARGRAR